jgi:hypothetical protein
MVTAKDGKRCLVVVETGTPETKNPTVCLDVKAELQEQVTHHHLLTFPVGPTPWGGGGGNHGATEFDSKGRAHGTREDGCADARRTFKGDLVGFNKSRVDLHLYCPKDTEKRMAFTTINTEDTRKLVHLVANTSAPMPATDLPPNARLKRELNGEWTPLTLRDMAGGTDYDPLLALEIPGWQPSEDHTPKSEKTPILPALVEGGPYEVLQQMRYMEYENMPILRERPVIDGVVPRVLVEALRDSHKDAHARKKEEIAAKRPITPFDAQNKQRRAMWYEADARASAERIVAGRMADIHRIVWNTRATLVAAAIEKVGAPMGSLRYAYEGAPAVLQCDCCGDLVTSRWKLKWPEQPTREGAGERTPEPLRPERTPAAWATSQIFEDVIAKRNDMEIATTGKDLFQDAEGGDATGADDTIRRRSKKNPPFTEANSVAKERIQSYGPQYKQPSKERRDGRPVRQARVCQQNQNQPSQVESRPVQTVEAQGEALRLETARQVIHTKTIGKGVRVCTECASTVVLATPHRSAGGEGKGTPRATKENRRAFEEWCAIAGCADRTTLKSVRGDPTQKEDVMDRSKEALDMIGQQFFVDDKDEFVTTIITVAPSRREPHAMMAFICDGTDTENNDETHPMLRLREITLEEASGYIAEAKKGEHGGQQEAATETPATTDAREHAMYNRSLAASTGAAIKKQDNDNCRECPNEDNSDKDGDGKTDMEAQRLAEKIVEVKRARENIKRWGRHQRQWEEGEKHIWGKRRGAEGGQDPQATRVGGYYKPPGEGRRGHPSHQRDMASRDTHTTSPGPPPPGWPPGWPTTPDNTGSDKGDGERDTSRRCETDITKKGSTTATTNSRRNSNSNKSSNSSRSSDRSKGVAQEEALVCDKCEGPHASTMCPPFRKDRDKHPDAQRRRAVGAGMGCDGGNVFLRGPPQVMRMPGDGSCLFHSMLFGLKRLGAAAHSASQLRRDIAGYLLQHPAAKISDTPVASWVKWDSGLSLAKYCKRMQGGPQWGGGIELAGCSLLHNVNVHVYERVRGGNRGSGPIHQIKRISCFGGGGGGAGSGGAGSGGDGARGTVHVLYGGGTHYDALVVKPGDLVKGPAADQRKQQQQHRKPAGAFGISNRPGPPRSSVKPVPIAEGDMWRLQPGEFLNDNLVDFWLKYSVNRRAEEAEKEATAAATRPAHDGEDVGKAEKGEAGVTYRSTGSPTTFRPCGANVHAFSSHFYAKLTEVRDGGSRERKEEEGEGGVEVQRVAVDAAMSPRKEEGEEEVVVVHEGKGGGDDAARDRHRQVKSWTKPFSIFDQRFVFVPVVKDCDMQPRRRVPQFHSPGHHGDSRYECGY